ncbi:MAG: phosphoglycerate dehydrogenase [Rickettsiales bacterium]|jgi:D-3-phosphoglycerate dehydrogenase / 2-oxoglutarate reductase|nr:phosphoglycerate dehydrogenase [Rickettsiales bacterium]
MPKVLISDKMSNLAIDVFKKNNIEVDFKPGLTPNELKEIIADYDGLAIRSSTKVTKDLISAATNLKVIGRAGIGVDNVDLDAATEAGIIVMNTPFGNSTTTAEHAIAMMFAIARQIPQASHSTHQGKWEKSAFMGTELTNKTFGVIGCGNIGSIAAKKAKGLGMNVIAFDPFLTAERANDISVKKVELNELFAESDFITLHVPLTDKTRNILDKESLAKCKKGAYIINCARGGLVNEQDLKEALDSGHIAGAALDVFEVEPAKENVLFGHGKVICTPHLGASTVEAQTNVAEQVAEQLSNYLNDNVVENSINIAAISKEDAKEIAPYLALGSDLGNFIGALAEGAIESIAITYTGKVAKLNLQPLTHSIAQNILRHATENVNIVNSLSLARKRGINVNIISSNKKGDYATEIAIDIITNSETVSIAGTLFGQNPRIISINNVQLEAKLQRNTLFIKNQDKTGFIGHLGLTLAEHKINVANFHLGRKDKNTGEAIALISVDNDISDDLLAIISKLEFVTEAKFLKLHAGI